MTCGKRIWSTCVLMRFNRGYHYILTDQCENAWFAPLKAKSGDVMWLQRSQRYFESMEDIQKFVDQQRKGILQCKHAKTFEER